MAKKRKTKKIKSVAENKAFMARGCDGENCAIIFATSNIEARRFAANKFNCDFSEIDSVRRAPQFDQYKWAGKVPASALICAGWHFQCDNTGEMVDGDSDYYIDDKDNVYINFEAYKKSLRYRIREKLKHENVICQVRCKFPFAQEIRWNGGYKDDENKVRRPVVYFKYSENASMEAEYLVGTNMVYISKVDLEIWQTVLKINTNTIKIKKEE